MRDGDSSTRPYSPRATATSPGASRSSTVRATSSRTTAASSAPASWARLSSRRWRISSAALRVKVMARMSEGAAPASSSRSMRVTSSHVLPLPAQASTTTERSGSQAAREKASGETGAPSRS